MRISPVFLAAAFAVPVCAGNLTVSSGTWKIQPRNGDTYAMKVGQTVVFTARDTGAPMAGNDSGSVPVRAAANRVIWNYDKLVMRKVGGGRDFIQLKAIAAGTTILAASGAMYDTPLCDKITITVSQ